MKFNLKKIPFNIRKRIQAFIVSLCTIVMGIYVFGHLNYLDDPRITPFPPSPQYREALGFTDDWWFATLLIIAGFLTVVGIVLAVKKIIDVGLIISSGIYMLLFGEFAMRGIVTPHFNITWIVCGGMEALILSIIFKGSDNDEKY